MKKLLKKVGIIIIVVGVLFGVYTLFVAPNGYTSEEEVVTDFFMNINSPTVCEETWYEDTQAVCEFLVTELGDKEIVITETVDSVDGMLIRLTADSTELEFYATFDEYSPTGLRSIMNDTYYKIIVIE